MCELMYENSTSLPMFPLMFLLPLGSAGDEYAGREVVSVLEGGKVSVQ